MLVLATSDVDQATQFQTRDGQQSGIRYRGHDFINRQSHPRLQDAIKACRHDLDHGVLSIIVQDQNQFGVWAELRA